MKINLLVLLKAEPILRPHWDQTSDNTVKVK